MKKAFQLSINVNDDGTRSGMTLVYKVIDHAKKQLELVTNYYANNWKVPTENDEHWHIFAATSELACINFEHVDDEGKVDQSFSGMITECNLMEKGDMVAFMPGTVVKLTNQPNVCLQISEVYLEGQQNVDTKFPIDLESGEPVQPEMSNIELASREEAKKYFECFDKITNPQA